jgi:hypothetical protein
MLSAGVSVSRPKDRGREDILGSLLDCGVHSCRGACLLFGAVEEFDVLHRVKVNARLGYCEIRDAIWYTHTAGFIKVADQHAGE